MVVLKQEISAYLEQVDESSEHGDGSLNSQSDDTPPDLAPKELQVLKTLPVVQILAHDYFKDLVIHVKSLLYSKFSSLVAFLLQFEQTLDHFSDLVLNRLKAFLLLKYFVLSFRLRARRLVRKLLCHLDLLDADN